MICVLMVSNLIVDQGIISRSKNEILYILDQIRELVVETKFQNGELVKL